MKRVLETLCQVAVLQTDFIVNRMYSTKPAWMMKGDD